MTITPRNEVTEVAIKLLIWAETDLAAEHILAVGAPKPRIGRTTLGLVSPKHVRRQAAVFRMVSVVEAFLDTLSRELTGSYVPYRTKTLNLLLEDFDVNTTFSWQQREDAYRRYHGIELKKCAAWDEINAAIQARNSIAHGLGRITPKQVRKANLASQLKAIDISIVNGELNFGEKCLTLVRDACSEFVKAVDALTP
ncbi:hypothetical protein AB0B11_19275 [Micromonospora tulbaghiae]|uniref:hypothetical protein n=1 Tax=Micromonospora tulbaghiae TaxID=479978 RepID=UPI0033F78A5B